MFQCDMCSGQFEVDDVWLVWRELPPAPVERIHLVCEPCRFRVVRETSAVGLRDRKPNLWAGPDARLMLSEMMAQYDLSPAALRDLQAIVVKLRAVVAG